MGDPARKIGVPPEYEPLVRQLAILPERDRRAVIAAAEADARPRRASDRQTASWETIDAISGVVSLGGDAIEDCEKLYDG